MKKTVILTVLLTGLTLTTTSAVSSGLLGIGGEREKMKCKVEYTLKNTESGLVEEAKSIYRFTAQRDYKCKIGTKKLAKKVKKLIKNGNTIQDINPIECKIKVRNWLPYHKCGSKYDNKLLKKVSN
jgi:hypothetical protein